MSQLIRKNLSIILKPQLLGVVLLLAVITMFNSPHRFQSDMYIGTFLGVFCTLIIASYNIKDRSQELFISLPISRRDVINSRYIEGLIYAIAGPIFVFLLQLLRIITGAELLPFFPDVIISMAVALLMLAVFCPLFSLSLGTIVLYTIFIVLFFLFTYPLISMINLAQEKGGNGIFAIILFACVMMYSLSYLLSMKIYKEKDI